MAHFPPQSIDLGKGSKIYWSEEPTGHLLIFAHGFYGDAMDTWRSLPTGLLESREGKGIDCLFYGYDSVRRGAEDSGVEFFHSLDTLCRRPAEWFLSSTAGRDRRSPNFCFQRLTIVAHSLGAAVVRFALVEHSRAGHPWGREIDLVLFAPAHRGAHVVPLVAATFGIGGRLVAALSPVIEWRCQAIRDLRQGSKFLTRLEEESRTHIDKERAGYLICRHVFWAEYDDVVIKERFLEDRVAHVLRETNHTSICKTRPGYLGPLQIVRGVIR